jgi:hypothetical protein
MYSTCSMLTLYSPSSNAHSNSSTVCGIRIRIFHHHIWIRIRGSNFDHRSLTSTYLFYRNPFSKISMKKPFIFNIKFKHDGTFLILNRFTVYMDPGSGLFLRGWVRSKTDRNCNTAYQNILTRTSSVNLCPPGAR